MKFFHVHENSVESNLPIFSQFDEIRLMLRGVRRNELAFNSPPFPYVIVTKVIPFCPEQANDVKKSMLPEGSSNGLHKVIWIFNSC